MATIKDVAKKANVSISTVSHVVNGTKFVSSEITQRVEEAIKELNYSTNYDARSMKSKRTMRIGFIALDMCGLYFPYVLKEANKVAESKGYAITISDSNCSFEQEKSNITDLIMRRVDGIIFSSIVKDAEMAEYSAYLHEQIRKTGKNIKLFSIERDFSAYGIDSICTDIYHGACQAMQHLIDLGCQKVAHICAPIGTGDSRHKAYRDVLTQNGLEVDERLILQGNLTHNSGYENALHLLNLGVPFDAVFVANDQMSIGVLQAFAERGIRIPEDIKVIGFDDVFVCDMLNPSLSSVHVQKRLLGKKSMEILIDNIENNHADRRVYQEEMKCTLIVRKSTNANHNIAADMSHISW